MAYSDLNSRKPKIPTHISDCTDRESLLRFIESITDKAQEIRHKKNKNKLPAVASRIFYDHIRLSNHLYPIYIDHDLSCDFNFLNFIQSFRHMSFDKVNFSYRLMTSKLSNYYIGAQVFNLIARESMIQKFEECLPLLSKEIWTSNDDLIQSKDEIKTGYEFENILTKMFYPKSIFNTISKHWKHKKTRNQVKCNNYFHTIFIPKLCILNHDNKWSVCFDSYLQLTHCAFNSKDKDTYRAIKQALPRQLEDNEVVFLKVTDGYLKFAVDFVNNCSQHKAFKSHYDQLNIDMRNQLNFYKLVDLAFDLQKSYKNIGAPLIEIKEIPIESLEIELLYTIDKARFKSAIEELDRTLEPQIIGTEV